MVKAHNLIDGDGSYAKRYDPATLNLKLRGVSGDTVASTPLLVKDPFESKDKEEKNHKPEIPKKANILTCRNDTFIGTFNVRTVREGFKRLELAKIFKESGLEVLGIQEA